MGKLAYSNKQIESMIKGIEDGSITEWNLPVDYYDAMVNYLSQAVMQGFGATLETVSKIDLPMLEELLTNVYMFSAAKTFQQTQELSSLLVDENGNVRTSREFNKLGKETYDTWNENYGLTEYNTAIAQADAAVKWQDIERNKDILPILEYSAIGDACDICGPLDGLTAYVDDPIWDSIAPTNHFNCKCLLKQREDDIELTSSPEDIVNPVVEAMKEKKQDIFINNVGKTGQIFPKDHPYYDVAKEYKEYAKANFNLPIPEFAQ
jgi:SPP1 gp7 family putative phage head morphogenesis protein